MLRLFVAVPVPEDVAARVGGLMGGLPGARWAEEEDLHLTLRFVGEVDEGRAADIDAELSRVRFDPFPLLLSGVGLFGTGRNARVVWIGVEPVTALSILHGRVESAVVRAGEPADPRAFTPHVTLARLNRPERGRLTDFLSGNAPFRAGPFMVDRFQLRHSHLGHRDHLGHGTHVGRGGGSRHEMLRDYPAAGAPEAVGDGRDDA